MQRFTYVVFINLAHYYGKRPCQYGASRMQLLSLELSLEHKCRSQTNEHVIWPGNEIRVRMCTKLENGVLHNGQQPQSVVNDFY